MAGLTSTLPTPWNTWVIPSVLFFVMGQLIFYYYPGTPGQWPVFILFLSDLSHFAARFARLSFMSCEYALFIIILELLMYHLH